MKNNTMKFKTIEYLEDCETLQEAITTAKQILTMYDEPETTFYYSLHCDEFKDNKKNKQEISKAKKHITKLKNFIKGS